MIMARHKYAGTPWLYDEVTGDIVGVKDPDGSEFYFARAANYGLFRNMVDQTSLANTPKAVQFDTPLIENGIVLAETNKLVFARGGLFNFTLTCRIENSDNKINNFYLWGRLNGTDIQGTLTRTSVTESHGGNPGSLILERSYLAPMAKGDSIQVMWMADNANVILQATDAVEGPPALPSGPSASLAVYEVAA
jgi:hypothetical protein